MTSRYEQAPVPALLARMPAWRSLLDARAVLLAELVVAERAVEQPMGVAERLVVAVEALAAARTGDPEDACHGIRLTGPAERAGWLGSSDSDRLRRRPRAGLRRAL